MALKSLIYLFWYCWHSTFVYFSVTTPDRSKSTWPFWGDIRLSVCNSSLRILYSSTKALRDFLLQFRKHYTSSIRPEQFFVSARTPVPLKNWLHHTKMTKTTRKHGQNELHLLKTPRHWLTCLSKRLACLYAYWQWTLTKKPNLIISNGISSLLVV